MMRFAERLLYRNQWTGFGGEPKTYAIEFRYAD